MTLYAGMRASFEAAGFTRFTDVRDGEPYSEITRLGQSDEGPVMLVHQDVRLDRGHGAADLDAVLDRLTATDPLWSVAGNAGGTRAGDTLLHLRSPAYELWRDDLPVAVTSLDENLLILRPARRPRCTAGLSGFHLYGTDVCLNAARDGSSCYVIDFRVTHLSMGNKHGYEESSRAFRRAWRFKSRPRYVRTTNSLIGIGPLDSLFNYDPVRYRMERRRQK